MRRQKLTNLILKVSLFLSIPLLLMLMQKRAVALKGIEKVNINRTKVKKPSLPKSSLDDRVKWLEKNVRPRIEHLFKAMDFKKGKTKITIIVNKKEKIIDVWTRSQKNKWITSYRMTAYSGKKGPKNKQGDLQIPEGIYRASTLNPNSRYYLSIGVNYPNDNDRKRGLANSVPDLGGDIFIHGRDETIGCIPIGDHWMEELFYIVSQVGLGNTRIVITPSDLPLPSLKELGLNENNPLLKEKYQKIGQELSQYHFHKSL